MIGGHFTHAFCLSRTSRSAEEEEGAKVMLQKRSFLAVIRVANVQQPNLEALSPHGKNIRSLVPAF